MTLYIVCRCMLEACDLLFDSYFIGATGKRLQWAHKKFWTLDSFFPTKYFIDSLGILHRILLSHLLPSLSLSTPCPLPSPHAQKKIKRSICIIYILSGGWANSQWLVPWTELSSFLSAPLHHDMVTKLWGLGIDIEG